MKPTAARLTAFRQAGLTLVEILIALLLGLFIIASVISIFVFNKQTYTLNESLSRLQEDGRFVMEILGSRLRSAGYAGCYGDISAAAGIENVLNNQTTFAWNLTTPLQGYNNVAANLAINSTGTTSVATASIAGTDALVIKGMGEAAPIASTPNNTSFTIAATNNRFNNGEILFAANCDRASLFQATSITTAGAVTTINHVAGGAFIPGNSLNTNNTYSTDAQIGRLESFLYNIQNGANGRPALWERRLVVTGGNTVSLTAVELIPNVANMQLAFGVDTSGDKDTDVYQDAAAVADWGRVVSIRFALLFESNEDNQVPAPESYTFNAVTFTYDKDNPAAANANRRFRRIFTGVVTLRNRIL